MFLKDQLVGKYRILEPIGSGGFGAVFLAEDTLIHKKVAIKVPHHQGRDVSGLLKEARLMATLNHPHIVAILTADEADGNFFIVMEYVAGGSLADLLEGEGPLPEPRVAGIASQVARGVSMAHKEGIIHRDLRPTNVLLTTEGDAKVVDFSISRAMGGDPYAKTRIGSPPYMAPEAFAGKTVFASDVYSIGVMMYEMLTGQLPYFDINPARVEEMANAGRCTPPHLRNRRVSREFSEIVAKSMARDPAQRHASARELAMDLEAFIAAPKDEKEIRDARERIKTRFAPREEVKCWKCGVAMPRHSRACPKCGAA